MYYDCNSIISSLHRINNVKKMRMNFDQKRVVSLILLFTLFAISSIAGTIKGTILDKTTKDPLTGATVQIVGTSQGAVADIDGNYTINIKAGTYTLEIKYVGYKEIKRTEVKVGKAEMTLNFEMENDAQALGEVAVVAKKNLENEKALQMERQKATLAIENIGAKEMSLKGISNVEEGVKKITGVSIASAGQLIVRGLGDRYSTTTLNGLPIASPNPDNKLIPLDLFPSSTVQNITVSKVYQAGAFADYSGAHIDISTKEGVGKDFFSSTFSVGGKFNTLGKDFYSSNRKGSIFKTNNINHRYLDMSLDEFEKTIVKEDPFGTTFAIQKGKPLPEFSGSIGGGKNWIMNNGNQLSLLASIGISNSSQILKDAYVTTLTAQGNELNHFDYTSYSSELKMAGLLNLGYHFRRADHINYTLFYARNAIDDYMARSGFDSEGVDLLGSNSVFHAYSLLNNQLTGHHELGQLEINWSGSYGSTGSDEPDRRQVMFRKDENGQPSDLFTLNQQETMRYFGELNETETVGDLRATYHFNDKDLIRLGGTYKTKSRDYQCARFYYNLKGLDANITNIYDTDDYLNQENIANGSIIVNRNMQPRNRYNADNDIWAAFAETEYYPTDNLLVSVGLRYEQSKQTVDYYSDGGTPLRAELKKGDLYPALNLKYSFTKEQSLRFSLSRTVTRPAFIEMAPFLYQESYGSAALRGNADLQNGYNFNVDLRYDFFPKNSSDMFSATGYFKYLDHPIERVQQSEGGSAVHSFRNANDGIAAGVEIEIRKSLFNDFRIGANGSYMYTNVKLPEGEGIYTDSQRSLQGASPYLLNADLSYAPHFSEEKQMTLALVYNLQGPRIQTVGIYGLGNIEQQTIHTLDFVASYDFSRHFSIKMKAKDLLNSTVRFKQDVPQTGKQITVESFQPGTSAEIGFSYQF